MSTIPASVSLPVKKNFMLEIFFSILMFMMVLLYWIGKEPDSFQGIRLPFDISYLIIGLVSGIGVLQFLRRKLTFSKGQLVFVIAALLTPFPGLIGLAAHKPELLQWNQHVMVESTIHDTMLGFRPVITQCVIFLFCAPVFARFMGKTMMSAITLAIAFHVVWGIAQVAVPISPVLLEKLPILSVGVCWESGEMCANTVRAVGLTPNPFFFSFLLSSYAALYVRKWDGWQGKMGLLLSCLSISRSFIIAAFIVLVSRLTVRNFLFLLLLLAVPAYLCSDLFSSILGARFADDISYASRSSTNMLALEEFFVNGNIFGIGFAHPYFTDSTFATLLLSGGLGSVLLYVTGWLAFFKTWYKSMPLVERRVIVGFAIAFFVLQMLVGSADAQPGELLFFVAYWNSIFNKRDEVESE